MKAFTLVELIVVITILAILWTIAFISLQWYSRDARDSTRIADINSINTQLELFVIKTWTLPIPENNIELVSSWITIWYQWYADKNTLNILKVFNWWLDPVDQSPYTYRINASKKAYQIMWFLENWNQSAYNFLPQANAATNLTNRFPFSKWNELWILLEQTTNNPIQYTWPWVLELSWSTTAYNTYISNTKVLKYNWDQLKFPLLTLWDSKYKAPEKCPTWFILVPWDAQFNQKWFCVAKYEMSYADADIPSPNNIGNYNTVLYTWSKIPVSIQWKYPIANINQWQAISSCQSMWKGYHLITNNEWTTIARNIEQQSVNWSSWQVWSWYIYNWVSESTMWCSWSWYLNNAWFTITWDVNCTWQRNRLILSNQEEIWDLAWNLFENVNRANTIDWKDFHLWKLTISWSSSWTTRDDDWVYSKVDMDKYWSFFWYWVSKGMWNLFYANWKNDGVLLRWWAGFHNDNVWIFTLFLLWWFNSQFQSVGFRCAL